MSWAPNKISILWLVNPGNHSVHSCLVTVLCLKFVLFLVVVLAHEIFPYVFTTLSLAKDLTGPYCRFRELFLYTDPFLLVPLLRQILSILSPLNFDHYLLNLERPLGSAYVFPSSTAFSKVPLGRNPGWQTDSTLLPPPLKDHFLLLPVV